MQTWKQKTGSKATYSKLIKIFERAGFKNCADKVRRIAQLGDSESDDSNGSGRSSLKWSKPLPTPHPNNKC